MNQAQLWSRPLVDRISALKRWWSRLYWVEVCPFTNSHPYASNLMSNLEYWKNILVAKAYCLCCFEQDGSLFHHF